MYLHAYYTMFKMCKHVFKKTESNIGSVSFPSLCSNGFLHIYHLSTVYKMYKCLVILKLHEEKSKQFFLHIFYQHISGMLCMFFDKIFLKKLHHRKCSRESCWTTVFVMLINYETLNKFWKLYFLLSREGSLWKWRPHKGFKQTFSKN